VVFLNKFHLKNVEKLSYIRLKLKDYIIVEKDLDGN
jgi:hypothetical protein